MNFDYLLISGRTDGPTSLQDYIHQDILRPIGKTDVYTFNERQLGFAISGVDNPAKHVAIGDIDEPIVLSAINNNKESTLRGYYSRAELLIESVGNVEILNNPLKANVIIADTRCVTINEDEDYKFASDTLLMVEFDDADFLPIRIFGEIATRVVDVWKRNKMSGFAAAVDSSVTPRLTIEGRDAVTGKFIQYKMTYTRHDNHPSVSMHIVTAEKSRPAYKRMEALNKFHAILPRKCGIAPTSIILTTMPKDEIVKAVKKTLVGYPRLKGYGAKINTYEIDDLRNNQLTKLVKVGVKSSTKKGNTLSCKGEYFDMNDINIIILDREKINFKDQENYIADMSYFWNEGVIWRFPRNTIRTITIVKDDIIPLPSLFRKEVKLRYIELMDATTNRMSPFISNRF